MRQGKAQILHLLELKEIGDPSSHDHELFVNMYIFRSENKKRFRREMSVIFFAKRKKEK